MGSHPGSWVSCAQLPALLDATIPPHPMRTLLSQFCEEFDTAVRPLLEPLRRTAESLAESPKSGYSRAVLPDLLDVADQFTVLADKVAEQQAYVLIFGPLKSGKSTLMNAMSAAYVSEVTSLPAYPCMVYVSDSDSRKFTVTRYNGDTEVFQDPAALRMQVARAHTELADRIRKVESEGLEFDPLQHFDEAIRRVDVKVPAGELAHSGSVLVDTPGLYSRMKFGYDRMTKEFRNAAACAIFVVKTDNLFLEQVFDEFNKLLSLFSRIFLVVNLDSTKKDVMPDGSLVPSLESDDPIRVVEAFENLAMSQGLKAAADEGRLRIYPVDLINAASQRLTKGPKIKRTGDVAKDTDEFLTGISNGGQADFDMFMRDLSEYLGSTDYLVAFLGDSIRRAKSLLDEADGTMSHPEVVAITSNIERLETEQEECKEKLGALTRLSDHNWRESLAGLERELREVGTSCSKEVSAKNAGLVSDALDSWFQKDASLKKLVQGELQPLITSSQRGLALTV
ncbi:MAG: energy-coupling factor transporter ATP-binding protein EcfA2, partial [Planctomycetota bacterium]